MSKLARYAAFWCLAGLVCPTVAARAGVPDPSRSSVSTLNIALEGATNGVPDDCSDGRCGDVTVAIRDFANNPIASSAVVIDFSGCSDLQVACDQLNAATGQTALAGKKILGITNALGQFTFKAQGASSASLPGADTAPGTRAGVECATLYADGVPIRNLVVAAYDVDGLGSPDAAVNASDVALVTAEALRVLLGGTPRARGDYNGSHSVNSADVGISSAMAMQQAGGTGSRRTAPFCP